MKRKKRTGILISGSIIIGIVVAIMFYMLFGWMMLVRYILGALLFATITVALVGMIHKAGKKINVRL